LFYGYEKNHAYKLICKFNDYYVTLMFKIYIDSNQIKNSINKTISIVLVIQLNHYKRKLLKKKTINSFLFYIH
jgi:hypothetical protein